MYKILQHNALLNDDKYDDDNGGKEWTNEPQRPSLLSSLFIYFSCPLSRPLTQNSNQTNVTNAEWPRRRLEMNNYLKQVPWMIISPPKPKTQTKRNWNDHNHHQQRRRETQRDVVIKWAWLRQGSFEAEMLKIQTLKIESQSPFSQQRQQATDQPLQQQLLSNSSLKWKKSNSSFFLVLSRFNSTLYSSTFDRLSLVDIFIHNLLFFVAIDWFYRKFVRILLLRFLESGGQRSDDERRAAKHAIIVFEIFWTFFYFFSFYNYVNTN